MIMSEQAAPNIGAAMMTIHRGITRGLAIGIERGTGFARQGYPDAATQAGFVTYVQTLVTVTSAHHISEDEVAFPYLRGKLPDVPFDRLLADHRVMERMLEELKAAASAVAGESEAGQSLSGLTRILVELAELWHPHIGIEERDIYAIEIIAGVMDVDENVRVGQMLAEKAQQYVVPPYLGVPWLLYNLPPDVRASFARTMPPTVTEELVPVTWKAHWAPMRPFLLD
jgi:hemerythrin-like domain-containing protein